MASLAIRCLEACLERIGDLRLEEVLDSGLGNRCSDTRLVEAATAEAATVATVNCEVVVRLVADGQLGLELIPGLLAHLALRDVDRTGRRIEQRIGQRRVLANVLIEAQ